MKFLLSLLVVFFLQSCVSAESKVLKDIPYKSNSANKYENDRCKLDIYLTKSASKSPVLVWFHGGGIKAGSKDKETEVVNIAKKFVAHGIAFVAVNYRLHPKVKYPTYIEDCAASIKWTIDNAEKYNFDEKKVFIGGHSAGGYLSMMTSFKNDFTDKAGLKVNDIAGSIPVSGQTVTHSTVRAEMGVSRNTVIVDNKAPLYHSNKMKLPMLLIVGDKDLKMRAEESLLFYSAIKGNAKQSKYEMFKNRDHVSIVTKMIEKDDPTFKSILKFISEVSK